uniref:Uncharacterized protein n=1 Tax=Romanomermis culicivorax TaxID=13658 RepID=A0A915JLB4_ROMCU
MQSLKQFGEEYVSLNVVGRVNLVCRDVAVFVKIQNSSSNRVIDDLIIHKILRDRCPSPLKSRLTPQTLDLRHINQHIMDECLTLYCFFHTRLTDGKADFLDDLGAGFLGVMATLADFLPRLGAGYNVM